MCNSVGYVLAPLNLFINRVENLFINTLTVLYFINLHFWKYIEREILLKDTLSIKRDGNTFKYSVIFNILFS